MAVSFNEYGDSPKASFRDGKRVVVRTGTTAWSDVEAFATELTPAPVAPYGPVATAALPGNPILRVKTWEVIPFPSGAITGTSAAGLASYDLAQWTITYERPEYSYDDTEASAEGDPIPFLTHTWEGGGEFLTLPTEGLYWAPDGTGAPDNTVGSSVDSDTNAGIFIPTIEHQVTWNRVPNPPFSAIRSTISKVNNAELQLSTGLAAKETLLFLQPSIRREVTSSGARAWEVNYKFSERRVSAEDQTAVGGWNHFFRSDTKQTSSGDVGLTGFYRMHRIVDAILKDVYEQADFSLLFPS